MLGKADYHYVNEIIQNQHNILQDIALNEMFPFTPMTWILGRKCIKISSWGKKISSWELVNNSDTWAHPVALIHNCLAWNLRNIL